MTEQTQGVPGTLYGIGVGPGDPELLTVKAARLLARLDLVFVPRKAGGHSMARAIAAPYLDASRQEIVELDHQMTGRPAEDCAAWRSNAGRIARCLAGGRDAAFLTEGDPLFYSTFLHVWQALREAHPAIPVQVVPGVSSLVGAAAAAGWPLAAGRDRLAIVPHLDESVDLPELLAGFETVVLLKVGDRAAHLTDLVRRVSATHEAVFVERATQSGEVVVRDLATLAERRNDYFSLIIFRRQGKAS